MSIAANLASVQARIAAAARAAAREPSTVQLIAVSKLQPVEAIREAYAAGQRHFGENYVQELTAKQAALADLNDISWHFIGHLQSRKAKELCDGRIWVHGIDSPDAALKLNARAAGRGVIVPVFLQINIGGEESKSGIAPEEAERAAAVFAACPALAWKGLMTIPPQAEGEAARTAFRRMRALRDTLSKTHGASLALSMGMSADFEMAIAEGADYVRVGTAIFGERPP